MRRRIIIVSLAFHVALVFTMVAVGLWHLDRVEAGRLSVAIAVPLPPPPAPAGGAAPSQAPKLVPKHIAHGIVIPEKRPAETPTVSAAGGGGEGSGSGAGSGSGDTDSTGTCTENCGPGSGSAVAELPPVKKQEQTVFVPPTVLRGLRKSGETQIHPSDAVKTSMLHDGHSRVTAVFKVCVGVGGAVDGVTQLKSSGYAGYDQQLTAAMRGWVYQPYEIDGRPVPACGAVTFSYEIE